MADVLPSQQATQPTTIPKDTQHSAQQNTSSLSSSPRQFPTDLTSPILEADESENESPNEPVTPISSGRQSQEFTTRPSQDHRDIHLTATHQVKQPLVVNTAPTPSIAPAQAAVTPKAASPSAPAPTPATADQDAPPTPLSRRPTRGSTHSSSFRRSVSNMFKRSNSSSNRPDLGFLDQATGASESALVDQPPTKSSSRPFSMKTSQNTTRSNTPPSPGSPVKLSSSYKEPYSMPTHDDFKQKNRASTGLGLRGRALVFVEKNVPGRDKHTVKPHLGRRRASSFEEVARQSNLVSAQQNLGNPALPLQGSTPWAQLPDAGVGIKARRLSLSLPDDFQVDIGNLLSEFEYKTKFGRHGKHLGKGATSKVTLMVRKGCPGEAYAVKEFRAKTKKESQDDYEKKIKSEFSIAKSLHHPNIVETVRLCTDHGRFNHVMEYCSGGDLFSLLEKKYLQAEDRLSDRLCLWKQLVQGIKYLHHNGIAHRDIKPENLLITSDSKLKITDFGVSEVFSGTHPGLREAGGQCGKNMYDVRLCSPGICGSEPMIAPEVLKKERNYDPRGLDVWSAGVIMIYLTFGGALWKRAEDTSDNFYYQALVKAFNNWEKQHPDEPNPTMGDKDYPYFKPFEQLIKSPVLRRTLLSMLNPNPDNRATIDQIMDKKSWFSRIECCQLETYDDPATLIDASKKADAQTAKRVYCHNHLPIQSHGHSLGAMPGQAGY
ncbi:Serine/threonine-protein kinase HAL4/SAT4 [Colletotrichum spinosum]|uniref:Serine/threonine-protein kinase HAL4/SAT4 n=1 Tax=Colletotrichum spinosum TaxID=1347390 RepID=A0A4R8Q8I0_9PEZI|nr:Serine/threonine-protein kinase HAL4/SAT4 [Colletotrichum spinosum]